MGEARTVMDRVTEAVLTGNSEALKALYDPLAVLESPTRGAIRGPDEIAAYLEEVRTAFPDLSWESLYKYEIGDAAIDEGYFVGTHTGPITSPNGEAIPATGKRVRFRECDVATIANGVITSHRTYFDMLDVLTQLGLVPAAEA